MESEINDVHADEYVAFDEHGTVFRLWAEGQDVRVAATDRHDEEQLRQRLAAFVRRSRLAVQRCTQTFARAEDRPSRAPACREALAGSAHQVKGHDKTRPTTPGDPKK